MDRFPYVEVLQRRTSFQDYEGLRNMLAYQSALIRGDKEVVLDNAWELSADQEEDIRVPFYPDRHPQDKDYRWSFGHSYREGRGHQSSSRDEVGELPTRVGQGPRRGGFGIATLWDVIYDDGSKQKVVIKIPNSGTDITPEAKWHWRYSGASHVVQPVHVQGNARKIRANRPLDLETDEAAGAEFRPNEENVVVLEFAEHGNFFEMMAKASYFNIHFSNRVLWEIWECLVKGVASVAYQPGYVHFISRRGRKDLDKLLDCTDDPKQRDKLNAFKTMENSHDVHFDLEEQNVLIGEDPNHDFHPIFKIHDFGDFSHKMRECWNTWKEETFVKDWDNIYMGRPRAVEDFKGDNLSRGHPVAGRYGTWTNIFLIGQIMEGAITHKYITHPAQTGVYCTIDSRKAAPSYAWRLNEPAYRRVDPELRDLIYQCQFKNPADRPSIHYLLTKIAERKERGFDETEDDVRAFWKMFWERKRRVIEPRRRGFGKRRAPPPMPSIAGTDKGKLRVVNPDREGPGEDDLKTNRVTIPGAAGRTFRAPSGSTLVDSDAEEPSPDDGTDPVDSDLVDTDPAEPNSHGDIKTNRVSIPRRNNRVPAPNSSQKRNRSPSLLPEIGENNPMLANPMIRHLSNLMNKSKAKPLQPGELDSPSLPNIMDEPISQDLNIAALSSLDLGNPPKDDHSSDDLMDLPIPQAVNSEAFPVIGASTSDDKPPSTHASMIRRAVQNNVLKPYIFQGTHDPTTGPSPMRYLYRGGATVRGRNPSTATAASTS
ncbi:hypothetical protein PT974_06329 [Cladobotryum mycophilum]|uniref:Protein kinase domain-containing protein n=1 Tax=Cladobotryum mycophilum TaxID=491253 RepID=A0ABR0SL58_9HYPO